jgi:hypothetical protein
VYETRHDARISRALRCCGVDAERIRVESPISRLMFPSAKKVSLSGVQGNVVNCDDLVW